jgi:hypothetical protein
MKQKLRVKKKEEAKNPLLLSAYSIHSSSSDTSSSIGLIDTGSFGSD